MNAHEAKIANAPAVFVDLSGSLPQMAGSRGDAQAWPSGGHQIGLARRKPA
jgi:hypothetical protein